MSSPDPLYCTLWLVAAFCLAGAVQTWWLGCRQSGRFAIPLDGGKTFRGRRLLGDNKTWKGFVVMVPAVGVAFLVLASLRGSLGPRWAAGFWPISNGAAFWLGCWSGLGFMLGELPNSFIKRQLDILPAMPPRRRLARFVCFFVDQADSVVGALAALAIVVPVPIETWVALLLAGPAVHWIFNLVLMLLGVKNRAA